jgi:hypothetical protein
MRLAAYGIVTIDGGIVRLGAGHDIWAYQEIFNRYRRAVTLADAVSSRDGCRAQTRRLPEPTDPWPVNRRTG